MHARGTLTLALILLLGSSVPLLGQQRCNSDYLLFVSCGNKIMLASPEPVQAGQFGLLYDPASIAITGVSPAGALAALDCPENGKKGPGYLEVVLDADATGCDSSGVGVTVGWLNTVSGDPAQCEIPASPEGQEIFELEIDVLNRPAETSLCLADCVAPYSGGPVTETRIVVNGQSLTPCKNCYTLYLEEIFQRGDSNGDEQIDVGDAIIILSYLFGPETPKCLDALDVNDDGDIDIGDAIRLLTYLFRGPPAPPPPFPEPGFDPTNDALDCKEYSNMGVTGPCLGADYALLVARAIEEPGLSFRSINSFGYAEFVQDQTGIVLVLLPGGTFEMGSPDDEPDRGDNEGPVHSVILSPFLIGKYEVTQEEWQNVMGSNPSHFQGKNLPVETVSWDDCKEFCSQTGLSLPSEAQWEYACRAGTRTAYYFGNDSSLLADYAWFDENSEGHTHPVGEKKPNGFDLYDMHGNVSEWCEDVYDSESYSKPDAGGPDPVCTSGSEFKAGRSGSWLDKKPSLCRSARRWGGWPSSRDNNIGFRPVFLLSHMWYSYGGHLYARTLRQCSWEDAEAEAQSVGGHLVTINDADENLWLSKTFAHLYAPGGEGDPWSSLVWIGYHLVNGEWEWSSGEPVTYTADWWNGGPSTGPHAYIHTDTHPDPGTWWNSPTQDQHPPYGVIEKVPAD